MRKLTNPNFIVASSLIDSARRQKVLKLEQISGSTNKENAFRIYKNLLVTINMLSSAYKSIDLGELIHEWHFKKDTMNTLLDEMKRSKIFEKEYELLEEPYEIDPYEESEAYLKKKVTDPLYERRKMEKGFFEEDEIDPYFPAET